MTKPLEKTKNAAFSSGPCSKFPGWNLNKLSDFNQGRSHRSSGEKAKLKLLIDKTKKLLNIPEDYLVGILPASDTGAFECAMWNMLGARAIDVLAWESFSKDWAIDALKELDLENLNIYESEYGLLPDLTKVNSENDIVFVYNGTTSGVKVPNLDWISDDRKGLTLCDATSSVFAMDMDWSKLDVTTFSWQKVMGSEAAHGMIILSPNAVNRLENYQAPRPLPKIFRLTKNGKLITGIFKGATINTPSMLAVEDALITLNWIESNGGFDYMLNRSMQNLKVIKDWVSQTHWIDFLANDPETISNTSICLKITSDEYKNLSNDEQVSFAKDLTSLLAKENIAYDIASYRDAPSGIRIWGGGTVETSDLLILTKWLDWAYNQISQTYSKVA